MTVHSLKDWSLTQFLLKKIAETSLILRLGRFVLYDENFENLESFLLCLPKYKKCILEGKYKEIQQKLKMKGRAEETNNDYVANHLKNMFLLFDAPKNKNRGTLIFSLSERLLNLYPHDITKSKTIFL